MTEQVFVAGVGMIPFRKPGPGAHYDEMGAAAVRDALADAEVAFDQIQQAYAGYVFGDSTCGQKALYRVGMSGIPVVNVNNNCSTGSSALWLARQAVRSGLAECVLAFGFEEMSAGALRTAFPDRPRATERAIQLADELLADGLQMPSPAIRQFGGAGLAHMRRYGTSLETFAKIRAKASRHAARNPLAVFRKEMSAEEVLASPAVWDGVLTRAMCCPPTSGAAAAVLVSGAFARRHGLRTDVRLAAQAHTTDTPSTYEARDLIRLVGFEMSRNAAHQAYEEAGIGPSDVDVIELHDCFAQNELLSYEALGLCAEGEGARIVSDADHTYGGRWVVNPSGGLLSKGHPLGATGLAQCFELTQQLRGAAQARQVDGARVALQHNIGLGGACVVTLYERRA